jgi:hypothetical protein
MLARLDVEVILCGLFGGETGTVVTTLAQREGICLRRSPSAADNGSHIHDRRGGERESWRLPRYLLCSGISWTSCIAPRCLRAWRLTSQCSQDRMGNECWRQILAVGWPAI